MTDSIATPAKTKSAQPDFSHSLHDFRTPAVGSPEKVKATPLPPFTMSRHFS
jgi:hypothetical protein